MVLRLVARRCVGQVHSARARAGGGLAVNDRSQRVASMERVQDLVVVIDSLHVQNSAGAQSEVAGLRGCDGLEHSAIGCEERSPAGKNACKRSGSPWCCRGARSAP